jgi:hypothetical protein
MFMKLALFVCGSCFLSMLGAPPGRGGNGDGLQKQPTAHQQSSLSAAPDSVTFAGAPNGETYSQEVRLSNTAKTDVTIKDVTVLGSGIQVEGLAAPRKIEPGQIVSFKVTYKPSASESGFGSILIANSKDAAPVVIEVRASVSSVHAELTTDKNVLTFDPVVVGDSLVQDFGLTNNGNKDIKISRIDVAGNGFSVDAGTGVTLVPKQGIRVTARFQANSIGAKEGSILVFSDAANSPTRISLAGMGVAPSEHSAVVRWNGDPNAAEGYFVYRAAQTGGPYAKLNVAPTNQTEYEDSGLGVGQTYYYVITSVDSSNDESPYSNEVIVKIP